MLSNRDERLSANFASNRPEFVQHAPGRSRRSPTKRAANAPDRYPYDASTTAKTRKQTSCNTFGLAVLKEMRVDN